MIFYFQLYWTMCLLLLTTISTANATLTFRLKGRSIPSDGSGRVLITDIGPQSHTSLLCLSDDHTCCTGSANWYYRYGTSQEHRIESTDMRLGWKRNRGRFPGVVRLRSRGTVCEPGQCQEGVYTCEVPGDGVISVGLYYPVQVSLTFSLSSNLLSLEHIITCTSTGGSVLASSFTGPNGERLGNLVAMETPRERGSDRYSVSVTRSNGSHGDMFRCMASNGASTDIQTYTLSAALPPSNLTTEQLAPSVLKIRWIQEVGGANVLSYTVTTIYGDGVIIGYTTLKPTIREVTLQRLVNDGRTYTITVMAISDSLPGVATISIQLGYLGPPTLTISTVTSTTALLTLDHTHHTADDYRITYTRATGASQLGGCPDDQHNGSVVVTEIQESVNLIGLEEGSTYMVTVCAQSRSLGDSSESLPVFFTTLGAAPSLYPSNARAEILSSSSLLLLWDAINSCLHFNGVALGWQVIYWPLSGPAHNYTLFVPGSPLTNGMTRIDNLRAYTSYSLRVAAVNTGHLVGEYAPVVIARTMESVPGPILNLEETYQNATTIVVAWQPPEEPGGMLERYEVSYWLEDEQDLKKKVNVSANDTLFYCAIPSDAKQGVAVVFSVKAFTGMGPGPAKMVAVRLVYTAAASADPKPLSAFLISPNTANISWCQPSDATGNLTFNLSYHVLARNTKQLLTETSFLFESDKHFAIITLEEGAWPNGEGAGLVEEGVWSVEHHFKLSLWWTVGGERYLGEEYNTSLLLDKVLFQIQMGPIDHCITWTEDRAHNIEALLHSHISSYLLQHCPSCRKPSSSSSSSSSSVSPSFFLLQGVFLCQDNPHLATYRSSILTPSLLTPPPLTPHHNTTQMVSIIQNWVSSSPSLPMNWLLVRVNPECPAHITSLSAPENAVTNGNANATATISPLSSELVKACLLELEKVCNTPQQEPDDL